MVCLVQGNWARILPEFLCTKFGVIIGCPIREVCPFVTARVVIRGVGAVYYCIYTMQGSIEGDRRFYLSLSLIPILFQQSTKDIQRLLYKIAPGS